MSHPLPAPTLPVTAADRRQVLALVISICLVSACGLVYELLIATVSSYLLGNTVMQFSLAIGLFIGAMGVGSYFSQRITHDLLHAFVVIEMILAVAGGLAVPFLFACYFLRSWYWLGLVLVLFTIGTLIGFELPLLARLLKRYGSLRAVIAHALSIDYLGALLGSLLFPLFLLPVLGLMRSAYLVALLNIAIVLWNLAVFKAEIRRARVVLACSLTICAALLVAVVYSLRLFSLLESRLYTDQVLYAQQTPYQRIVVTRWHDDLRLFLDGHLQFSSADEYRYHESLVHPAMMLVQRPAHVLILGGGDGLAAREVLKYPEVADITLVDLDPAMTTLAATYPAIDALNNHAFANPRLHVVHQDAFKYLETSADLADVIIADLPDPDNELIAKLYSVEFYRLALRHLAGGGVFVTQSASPFMARQTFWCIAANLTAAGGTITPYHTFVPTFGDWGFILAADRPLHLDALTPRVPTRYLTPALLRVMPTFTKDDDRVPVDISTLDRPVIMHYYEQNNRRWQ